MTSDDTWEFLVCYYVQYRLSWRELLPSDFSDIVHSQSGYPSCETRHFVPYSFRQCKRESETFQITEKRYISQDVGVSPLGFDQTTSRSPLESFQTLLLNVLGSGEYHPVVQVNITLFRGLVIHSAWSHGGFRQPDL
jgi:hypothetical protein